MVLQASNKLRLDEIRQAFLMHLLDPMSIRHAEEIAKKEVLSRFALFAPALSEIYKSNFQLLVSKSLANAVDVRLSGASDADKQTRAERFLQGGFYPHALLFTSNWRSTKHNRKPFRATTGN